VQILLWGNQLVDIMNTIKSGGMLIALVLVHAALSFSLFLPFSGAAANPSEGTGSSGEAVPTAVPGREGGRADQLRGRSHHLPDSDKCPHTGDESSCLFCHVTRPQKKKVPGISPDPAMQDVCLQCHAHLTDVHFDGFNPFIDEVIRERAEKAGNFFVDGQEVCTTCHDPHDLRSGRSLLRDDFLSLCYDSRALNPHWNDSLCLSCHSEPPVEGRAPLREEGDKNNLCNRCHHSDYARPDIHPVGVIPSSHIRVPENLPLEEQKLTCETCHNSLLQMGCRSPGDTAAANPNFLRQMTVSRNAFCFLCHIEETYKRLNPHNQLNEQGEIVEATCLFCHAAIPDVGFIGPEKVSFIVQDPDEYCIGCHPGFTMNHPAGVNHLLEPSEKIMEAIKTSVERIGVELPLYNGRIVCATCHNPHQEGVIQIAAAATGTERANKLRLKPGRDQCTGCHWDK
jgi:predicted CXXCH cytochrome family protein